MLSELPQFRISLAPKKQQIITLRKPKWRGV